MFDDVVPDLNVDPVMVVPDSHVRLPVFGLDSFYFDQLLEASCPMLSPSHIGSFNLVEIISTNVPNPSRKRKQLLTPYPFEDLLCEVSQGPSLCFFFTFNSYHSNHGRYVACRLFIFLFFGNFLCTCIVLYSSLV